MRGIISAGGYVPYRRLDRSEIAAVAGSGGGRGTRTVASYDEDTTTMGVEAARFALRGAGSARPDLLLFSTVAPGYLDKTNATTIHAALRLDEDVTAFDLNGSVRSAVGALQLALQAKQPALVVSADLRTGLPGSADEAGNGDAAAALLVGDDSNGTVIAEYLGGASTTEEFLDRWRTPGDTRSKVWEERFGETKYVPLGEHAWKRALDAVGVAAADVSRVIVASSHARAARSLTGRLGVAKEALANDLSATVGFTGAAHPALLLTAALETASPGDVVALVTLADGADVLFFRATDAISSYRSVRPLAGQIDNGAPIAYGKFLTWRGMLPTEPPRRPEPDRISASVTGRTEDYKYGFVGSRDQASGALHLPPARVSRVGGAQDDMEPVPMSDVQGTISTITIDRIAYSQSPPIVFAIVDFEDGGRLPVELTDVDASQLKMGDRVEMTFRRLFTADGIHNYFWKARPVRG
ncbi:MAG: 3-hydroxy-3-methylglutaryl CoA synthase [Actinomycetia bacterium]|nr:3-hydroxy-3-methylglutaryl CoA synthase [Actinomycetes bacterium]